jgi:hypothetical protein
MYDAASRIGRFYFLELVANDWRPMPIRKASWSALSCTQGNLESAAFLCGDFFNANERANRGPQKAKCEIIFLHVTRLS